MAQTYRTFDTKADDFIGDTLKQVTLFSLIDIGGIGLQCTEGGAEPTSAPAEMRCILFVCRLAFRRL